MSLKSAQRGVVERRALRDGVDLVDDRDRAGQAAKIDDEEPALAGDRGEVSVGTDRDRARWRLERRPRRDRVEPRGLADVVHRDPALGGVEVADVAQHIAGAVALHVRDVGSRDVRALPPRRHVELRARRVGLRGPRGRSARAPPHRPRRARSPTTPCLPRPRRRARAARRARRRGRTPPPKCRPRTARSSGRRPRPHPSRRTSAPTRGPRPRPGCRSTTNVVAPPRASPRRRRPPRSRRARGPRCSTNTGRSSSRARRGAFGSRARRRRQNRARSSSRDRRDWRDRRRGPPTESPAASCASAKTSSPAAISVSAITAGALGSVKSRVTS